MYKYYLINNKKFPKNTTKENLYNVFYSLFLIFIFIIISNGLSKLIINLINLLFGTDRTLDDLTQNLLKIHEIPFILFVFVGPLIEEIIYRLYLSFKKIHIIISILFFEFYLFNETFIQFTLDYKSFIIFFILSVITIITITYFYTFLQIFLNKNNLLIYWISIFLFGVSHIFNLENIEFKYFYLYILFIVPQIIMGYFITNLRLKQGFFWGLLLHIIINTINALVNLI